MNEIWLNTEPGNESKIKVLQKVKERPLLGLSSRKTFIGILQDNQIVAHFLCYPENSWLVL